MLNFKLLISLIAVCGFACNTYQPDCFQCSGTEPFWTISCKDNSYWFNSMDGNGEILLGTGELIKNTDKIWQVNFKDATLRIDTGSVSCQYDMSGEQNNSYIAIFEYNKIKYYGCAVKTDIKK